MGHLSTVKEFQGERERGEKMRGADRRERREKRKRKVWRRDHVGGPGGVAIRSRTEHSKPGQDHG